MVEKRLIKTLLQNRLSSTEQVLLLGKTLSSKIKVLKNRVGIKKNNNKRKNFFGGLCNENLVICRNALLLSIISSKYSIYKVRIDFI